MQEKESERGCGLRTFIIVGFLVAMVAVAIGGFYWNYIASPVLQQENTLQESSHWVLEVPDQNLKILSRVQPQCVGENQYLKCHWLSAKVGEELIYIRNGVESTQPRNLILYLDDAPSIYREQVSPTQLE